MSNRALRHPVWGWRAAARWYSLQQRQLDRVTLNAKRVRRPSQLEGKSYLQTHGAQETPHRLGAGEQKRLKAKYPMHVISFNFQTDTNSCGQYIRFFNGIDEYSRTALAIIPWRL